MLCFTKTSNLNFVDVHVTPCISNINGNIRINTTKQFDDISWSSHNQIKLDSSKLNAYDLQEGTYVITIMVQKKMHTIQVNVPLIQMPLVEGYDVTSATSDFARDGRIRARVKFMPDGCAFLWTSGIVTSLPLLEDVPPGMYTVCPVDRLSTPIAHLHNSNIALVQSNRCV